MAHHQKPQAHFAEGEDMAEICEEFEGRLCLESEDGISHSCSGAVNYMINTVNVIIKADNKSRGRSSSVERKRSTATSSRLPSVAEMDVEEDFVATERQDEKESRDRANSEHPSPNRARRSRELRIKLSEADAQPLLRLASGRARQHIYVFKTGCPRQSV